MPLPLSPSMRLDDAVRAVSGLRFGRTDCAQPMLYALERGTLGRCVRLLHRQRNVGRVNLPGAGTAAVTAQRTGIAAKLVVVGMVSNGFSIADPNDAGMLDVVGFDTATPAVIADFIRRGLMRLRRLARPPECLRIWIIKEAGHAPCRRLRSSRSRTGRRGWTGPGCPRGAPGCPVHAALVHLPRRRPSGTSSGGSGCRCAATAGGRLSKRTDAGIRPAR